MNTTTEVGKNASAAEVPQRRRSAPKKAKPAKNAARAGKPTSKPKVDLANKKSEVIAMMKRGERTYKIGK